jgi:ribosome-interacting GTPase 1
VKDIGLVGVPFSGKSTLFTALTRSGSHGGQANVAVVPVPDPRLAVLTDMERSKKTVAAQVRFIDVPGGVSSAQGIAKLREVEALALVIRSFGADAEPAEELATVRGIVARRPSVVDSALHKRRREGQSVGGGHGSGGARGAGIEMPLRDAKPIPRRSPSYGSRAALARSSSRT